MQDDASTAVDISALAKELERKEGAEQAFLLVKRLPDREALEALEKAGQRIIKKNQPLALLAVSLYAIPVFLLLYRAMANLSWPTPAIAALVLIPALSGTILLAMSRRPKKPVFPEVVRRLAERTQSPDAIEPLLRFASLWVRSEVWSQPEAGWACWDAAVRLLPQLSPAQARALSPAARGFLAEFVRGRTLDLPKLGDSDRQTVVDFLERTER